MPAKDTTETAALKRLDALGLPTNVRDDLIGLADEYMAVTKMSYAAAVETIVEEAKETMRKQLIARVGETIRYNGDPNRP